MRGDCDVCGNDGAISLYVSNNNQKYFLCNSCKDKYGDQKEDAKINLINIFAGVSLNKEIKNLEIRFDLLLFDWMSKSYRGSKYAHIGMVWELDKLRKELISITSEHGYNANDEEIGALMMLTGGYPLDFPWEFNADKKLKESVDRELKKYSKISY